MRLFVTGIISALAAMASALTEPDYSQDPSGNAILKPGLEELVPVGKPYTITWDPTTKGSVSLILLRGPSSNVKPLETIVDSTPNTGTYVWTPETTLEPDTTHYGILLVVEGTGQYQYSTQFGISNPDYEAPGDSTSSSSTVVVPPTPSPSAGTSTTTTTAKTTKTKSTTTTTTTESFTTITKTTTEATVKPTSEHESTTVAPPTTTAAPTTTTTNPVIQTTLQSSLSTTPTPSPTTQTVSTGAAPRNVAGLGAVALGLAAVLAF